MRRAWLVIAVVAGCKAGNFLTVDVIGIPCDASSLHVTVELGNGAVSEHTFTDSVRIGDGQTSFAIDLGAHKTGVLLVTVEAITSTGEFSESTNASLPAGSVTIDLAQGGSCGSGTGSDSGTGSGAIDAGVISDADQSCGWNFDPTNYAPCAPGFPAASAAFEVTGSQTLDTDKDVGVFNSVVYNFNNTGEVLLIHATSFLVSAPDGKLTVHGARPLLIVVDGNAMVDGTIDFSATARPTTGCSITPAMPGSISAPGGAGGGFATQGGGGGDNGSIPLISGPPGGGATGNSLLTPLRPGCPGGDGGASTAQGGAGGAAGGAIEISSNATLAIAGTILAGGGGGNPGAVVEMKDASGGGGGGTGGAVLLEAIRISFDSAASVCAAGGGGGEGADAIVGSMAGAAGTCTPGAGGRMSQDQGGDGGTGGGSNNPNPGRPGAGSGTVTSGGGGGGSTGRIRVRGAQTGTATIVPPPTN